MDYKGNKCHDGKKSKERLTVGLGVNCTGSEKLTPIVIGKFKQPRCFKNVKNLPVVYEANRTAWMTGNICYEYFAKLDERMTSEGRKILMMMDSCPAHPKEELKKLKSIKFMYFPKNSTSRLQPLDLGIIKNVKLHYKNRLVESMIEHLDRFNNLDGYAQPTVLDAILTLNDVWYNFVKVETVQNCFDKAGFKKSVNFRNVDSHSQRRLSLDIDAIEEDAARDLPIQDNQEEFQQLYENLDRFQTFYNFNKNDFLYIDDDLATVGLLSDAQILEEISISQENSEPLESLESNQQDPSPESNETIPTAFQTVQACDILEKLALYSLNVPTDIFQCIQKLRYFAKTKM